MEAVHFAFRFKKEIYVNKIIFDIASGLMTPLSDFFINTVEHNQIFFIIIIIFLLKEGLVTINCIDII